MKKLYGESDKLPSDYLYHKRVTPIVSKDNCTDIPITSELREEGNVNQLLSTVSFDFEETFHTLMGNRIRVYHNDEFKINRVDLIYYRLPKKVSFSNLDTVIEFKDDVCEMLVDEAVKLISSDTENINQKQLAQERVETNN